MRVSKGVLTLLMVASAAVAWGQPNRREPHIGYVYPSGGQRGTTFEVVVGGQHLGGVTNAYVAGDGVQANVVQHYKPLKNLNAVQRQELQGRLRDAIHQRLTELTREGRGLTPFGEQFVKNNRLGVMPQAKKKQNAEKAEPVELPAHPLLRDLDNKSFKELLHVRNEFVNAKKRQPNMQIAETVLIEITISHKATPGDREIRLGTPLGLTNPMCFQVGLLQEDRELEPNDPNDFSLLKEDPPLELPILINGQIKPGDVDRFRFQAKRGQQLVIDAKARHLIPYLADAVPGWFQATLTLYDDHGSEVAFTDDYRFDPDPVLFYKVPETGEYELEIRDSIYRGREDFIYRLAVSEQPFITQTFPLGGRVGARTFVSIEGWNLSRNRLPLNTMPGAGGIRQAALRVSKGLSNPITYAADTVPDVDEVEPNDSSSGAQRIELPRIVNGRISQPGDVDVLQFKGRAGDEVVAEVFGRRLHSPLDSLLRLTDPSERVLEWNDDHEDRESGLCTHHADSYIRARLPNDGVYYVQLSDAQHQGKKDYGYRLRISPPRPDFALLVTPSSVNVPAGRAAEVCVHALRKDGFDGDVEVVLKDAPAGFSLSGGRIPSGRDRIRMTLTAPRERPDDPVVLELQGRASIGGQTVSRPAAPAEDMMQAFLYRHLAPSQQLMVAVIGKRPGPPIELATEGPIRIPAGGTVQVPGFRRKPGVLPRRSTTAPR